MDMGAHVNGHLRIPTGWKKAELGDLLGERKSKVTPRAGDDRAYVALEHMVTDSMQLIGHDTACSATSAKTVFQRGDLLFGKLRPNLRKCVMAPFDGVCSTDILALYSKNGAVPGFVLNLLHSARVMSFAKRTAIGTKMPRTSWDQLSQCAVLVPPEREQDWIADMLGAADDAIDATRRVIEQTRRLKTAVLQDLLTHGLPGWHSEFREVKGLGQVPRAWNVMTLKKAVTYWQYGLSESLADTGTYPCFRMNNYLNGRMQAADLKYIDLNAKALAAYRLQRGDILFNRTNSRDLVGKIGVFDLDGDYVFASYLVRLRANPEMARPEFLNLLLNTGVNQERIRRLATPGVSQSNINVESLKQFRVALPAIDEQDAIVEALNGLDQRRDCEIEAQRQLIRAKTALSQALLTGRVRVPAKEVGVG